MFLDITAIKDYSNVNNLKSLSVGLDVSKIILLLSNDPVVNSDTYISKLISMGFYNFARNDTELQYLYDNPNSYKDVAHLQKFDEVSTTIPIMESVIENSSSDVRVIGFKNFTAHAGATSLIYMLRKQLSKDYYTIAVEINKSDFMFFDDKNMISCKANEINNILIKYKDANVILVDLNDLDMTIANSLCSDILYLMESSTLMINKAVMLDNQCFSKLSGKKIVLNRSLLNEKDVKQLEFEANLKFFAVLPPMNDRADNASVLFPLLADLGLYKKV